MGIAFFIKNSADYIIKYSAELQEYKTPPRASELSPAFGGHYDLRVLVLT